MRRIALWFRDLTLALAIAAVLLVVAGICLIVGSLGRKRGAR